jgi:uncharacterized membrane protein YagU involved in acid resistance
MHENFAHLTQYGHELLTGVLVHYAIGIILAGFYIVVTVPWFRSPPLGFAPILYGAVTSAFAWLVMFPAVGFGYFGLRAPEALHLFRSSLCNHLSYGLGILIGLHLIALFRKPEAAAPKKRTTNARSLVSD